METPAFVTQAQPYDTPLDALQHHPHAAAVHPTHAHPVVQPPAGLLDLQLVTPRESADSMRSDMYSRSFARYLSQKSG